MLLFQLTSFQLGIFLRILLQRDISQWRLPPKEDIKQVLKIKLSKPCKTVDPIWALFFLNTVSKYFASCIISHRRICLWSMLVHPVGACNYRVMQKSFMHCHHIFWGVCFDFEKTNKILLFRVCYDFEKLNKKIFSTSYVGHWMTTKSRILYKPHLQRSLFWFWKYKQILLFWVCFDFETNKRNLLYFICWALNDN